MAHVYSGIADSSMVSVNTGRVPSIFNDPNNIHNGSFVRTGPAATQGSGATTGGVLDYRQQSEPCQCHQCRTGTAPVVSSGQINASAAPTSDVHNLYPHSIGLPATYGTEVQNGPHTALQAQYSAQQLAPGLGQEGVVASGGISNDFGLMQAIDMNPAHLMSRLPIIESFRRDNHGNLFITICIPASRPSGN